MTPCLHRNNQVCNSWREGCTNEIINFNKEKFQNTTKKLKEQFEEFKHDLSERTTVLEATLIELCMQNKEFI